MLGNFKLILDEPFTGVVTAVPVPSELTIPIFLAVPQFAVVIFALPLKLVPFIILGVDNLSALATFICFNPL